MKKAYLIFEDRTVFEGKTLGAQGQVTGKVKPYNGMTGYQEFLTEPSCFSDLICMSYPIIGSVGAFDSANSSNRIQAGGVIIKEANPDFSSRSGMQSFDSWLKLNNCVGICDVDTRSIIKHIKANPGIKAVITTVESPDIDSVSELAELYITENILEKVSVKEDKCISKEKKKKTLCVLDMGLSEKEKEAFLNRGIKLVIVPYDREINGITRYKPDGIYISNGPETSRFDLVPLFETIKALVKKYPVLACGNGHGVIAQSFGLIPEKMENGHHGVNYPVRDIKKNTSYITKQNHALGFSKKSILPEHKIEITHENVNDSTVEGLKYSKKVISVQFMPDEITEDFNTGYIWDDFISML